MATGQKSKTTFAGSVTGLLRERSPGSPAFRRLASSEEAWISVAMIRIMIKRLAKASEAVREQARLEARAAQGCEQTANRSAS